MVTLLEEKERLGAERAHSLEPKDTSHQWAYYDGQALICLASDCGQ